MSTLSATTPLSEWTRHLPSALDAPRLVLWDIDRTLVNTHGGTLRAMTRAGRAVFGEVFSLQGVNRTGRLDPHVLAEAAEVCGFAVGPAEAEAFRKAYTRILPEELHGMRLMRGALGLYTRCLEIDNLFSGVVTGNYAEAAMIKLSSIGLPTAGLTHSGYGTDRSTRPELVAKAMGVGSMPFVGEQTLVIGDSVHDVTAALANDCWLLAVATGDDHAGTLRKTAGDAPRVCVAGDLIDGLVPGFVASFLAGEGVSV